ncbi:ADP-ribosylglycohydrolase [Annulohypoxylon bovei var. microspora]|nr:ADP-ribosylglycohydrolase [Annulohypoxylon bovei var. microspora]
MGETESRNMTLPDDYLERVYAGVLGKLIGVYMGRPFEGWTHQRILEELGHIRYFVNERLGVPVVVTDDDVSGTFTFVRALEEHRRRTLNGEPITALDIGRTWLNNVIKNRTIFWWGGNGVSTEHTAFLNLKKGIPAPRSGAIATNGKTIAEQIGAQIFIDGFAMAAPGNPDLAARLAGEAGSVSHDGEAVAAARMWAAMEAEAFVSSDVDHLLDTGKRYVEKEMLIGTVIDDVRAWCKQDGDWLKTRQRIEDKYGYDKFPGFCHVVPNHAVMVMALIYAGTDFGEAMHIVNTCGWDTDCNSGNLGCLVAIMSGLAAFDDDGSGGSAGKVRGAGGRLDWHGPLADRALISSADGGYSINNAARIAYDIVDMGRWFTGQESLTPPKEGAQFHFSLPGSVQGFRATTTTGKKFADKGRVTVEQGIDENNRTGLAIRVSSLIGEEAVEVTTDTFAPPEVREMEIYELVGSPLVYPGQTIKALVRADSTNTTPVEVSLILKAYTFTDDLETFTSNSISLSPGHNDTLTWTIPLILGCRPIQAVGLSITAQLNGTIWLDYLRYSDTPTLTLLPIDPKAGPRTFYTQSFVNGADVFGLTSGKFVVAQDQGEGLVSYGTREWTNYRVVVEGLVIPGNIGGPAGVAFRVRGLNRYYAMLFTEKRIELVKARDNERIVLGSMQFKWEVDVPYTVSVGACGESFFAWITSPDPKGSFDYIETLDGEYPGGGVGLVATNGSVLAGSIHISK